MQVNLGSITKVVWILMRFLKLMSFIVIELVCSKRI